MKIDSIDSVAPFDSGRCADFHDCSGRCRKGIPLSATASIVLMERSLRERVGRRGAVARKAESPLEERITPGDHLVAFHYASGELVGVNPCHVSLQARAGHRYRAEVDDRNRAALICWLIDEQTGEKIEGYFVSLEPTMKGAE